MFRAAHRSNASRSTSDADIPENAIWFDLVTPTPQEDKLVEGLLGIAVPTREEMQEIEVTSRLYVENGARYMTATLMCQSDTATPKTTAGHLHPVRPPAVTVRYDEPQPVHDRRQQACRALARRRHRRDRC